MSLVLTGATGFLGSHLLRALIKNSHCVTILKRSTSSLSRITDLNGRYEAIDLDCQPLSDAFEAHPVDAVIHCATVYGRNGDQSEEVLAGNLMLPIRLLECAAAHGCKYFINTDSFFCKQLPQRLEQGIPLYLPQYTLSKYQFREWGKLWANQGRIAFINLQMEHLYGSNDSPGKFIPWLEAQFQKNVPFIDLTDGIQLRDFLSVDTAVQAYLQVLETLPSYHGFESYEVGTGVSTSLREFVEQLKEASGAQTELRFGALPRKPEEIMYSTAAANSRFCFSRQEDIENK